MWDFTWRLSDCEELSGGYLNEMNGACFRVGLFYQQENNLDNHLNRHMIDHNGQAESITPD